MSASPAIRSQFEGRSPADVKAPVRIAVKDLNFYYGSFHGLKDINLDFRDRQVTALIGPSGCGKSTLLRTFNRIYSLYPEQRAEGEILLDGQNVLDSKVDLNELRSRVGMVFQKPTPFPMSIYDNVAFGLRLYEKLPKSELDGRVEESLRKAALWDEVKDKMKQPGTGLSGGQQQRLCIARAIAVQRRADLGSRSDLDRTDRGADRAAACRLHHRHRDPQHAAGRAHLAVHGVHVSRRADRVRRHHEDLHESGQAADPGLHHRPLRLSPVATAQPSRPTPPPRFDASSEAGPVSASTRERSRPTA